MLKLRFFRRYRKTLLFLSSVYLIFYAFFPQKIITKKNLDESVETQSYLDIYNKYKLLKENQSQKSDFKVRITNGRLDQLYKEKYLIIQYTPIFGTKKLCNKYNEIKNEMFLEECPYKNCEFTCDQKFEDPNAIILFHEWDLTRDPSLLDKAIDLHAKNPNKLFVLYNDEADPINEKFDKVYFNWTMSYRLDAEVSDCSYGCFYKRNNQSLVELNKLKNEFETRKSEALWFVSNCLSKYRIDFANKLSEFINLNVHGSCKNVRVLRKIWGISFESFFGKLVFLIVRNFSRMFSSYCGRGSECEALELKKNKFYLSFESKNCSNYISRA